MTYQNIADIDLATLTDADVAPGVRFDKPQSQFAPDGMVNPVTGNKPINATTTTNLNVQNYRMGKFMR